MAKREETKRRLLQSGFTEAQSDELSYLLQCLEDRVTEDRIPCKHKRVGSIGGDVGYCRKCGLVVLHHGK